MRKVVLVVLENEPRALHMLLKCSIAEYCSQMELQISLSHFKFKTPPSKQLLPEIQLWWKKKKQIPSYKFKHYWPLTMQNWFENHPLYRIVHISQVLFTYSFVLDGARQGRKMWIFAFPFPTERYSQRWKNCGNAVCSDRTRWNWKLGWRWRAVGAPEGWRGH